MQKSFEDSYIQDTIKDLDSDPISVECLEQLKLDKNPFVDHAKDPFLFIDQQLEMSINVFVDYLQNQNSTLVLLGEVGIGKTTQLRLLLRRGYQHFNYCTVRAKSKMSFAEIEKKFRERWRLPVQQVAETMQADEYIKQYIESDKNPVLIIDDAHRLQNQTLDTLLQLKHRVGLKSRKALGLVLASEPRIQTQLAKLEQSNPAAAHIYQINARALDNDRCEKYISYRLKKAGASDKTFFSAEELQDFYTKSKGLPRIINKLAREEISKKCRQPIAVGKFNSRRLWISLAALLGIAFIVVAALLNAPDKNIGLTLNKPEATQKTGQDKASNPGNETSSKVEDKITATNQAQKLSKPYVAPLVLAPSQIEVAKDEINHSQPLPADWLLKQNPDAYTIQIVASPSLKSLLAFAEKNLADKQTAYYQKPGEDKPWLILVYGIFPTREEALTAIDALPPNLQKNKPYPLQIDKIQQDIGQP